jgi:outer membrane protein assembly factor BamB
MATPAEAGHHPPMTANADQSEIVGFWRGKIGARERVDSGFELRRSETGEPEIYLWQPILNMFGFGPGHPTWDGERLTFEPFQLDLRLRDGRLVGTFPGPTSKVTLRRVGSLPAEKPVPRVPTLPAPRWDSRPGGQIYASPVLHRERVFVGTTGGTLNAINVADGSIGWAVPIGKPIFGDALADESQVVFATDGGELVALATADGTERWRYRIGDERVGRMLPNPNIFDWPEGMTWDHHGVAPVAAEGTLFVGGGDGSFHAVDAVTGERRWRRRVGGRIRAGAAIAGDKVLVASTSGRVVALDRSTGRLAWSADAGTPVTSAPVVAGNIVVIGTRGPGLFGFDLQTGGQRWRSTFWGSWVESAPAVHDGLLYIGASDLRRVSAIRPEDGEVLWRTDVRGWTWGTPLVVGDRIYAGMAGGRPYFCTHLAGLAILDRTSGRLVARRPLPEVPGAHQWGIAGSVVLAGSTLVYATIEGGVYGLPVE